MSRAQEMTISVVFIGVFCGTAEVRIVLTQRLKGFLDAFAAARNALYSASGAEKDLGKLFSFCDFRSFFIVRKKY